MDRVLMDSFDFEFKSALRNLKSAILLCALLFALCVPVDAQQPATPRIGYVRSFGAPGGRGVSAFLQGPRDLGYVEGQNIQIEYRHPKGNFEGTPDLVADLVQRKVERHCRRRPISDPIRQADDHYDSDCDGDNAGSSCSGNGR